MAVNNQGLANAGTLQDKPKTTLFGKKTELKMRTRIHEIKKLENIDDTNKKTLTIAG